MPTPDTVKHKPAPGEKLRPILFYVPFLMAVGLQLVGAFVPRYPAWGINVWTVLPVWAIIALAAIYVAASLPPISATIASGVLHTYRLGNRAFGAIPRLFSTLLSSAILLAIFYLLRSRALVYGDGFLVMDRFSSPLSAPLSDVHEISKPLTTYAYRLGHFLFSIVGGVHPQQAAAIVSAIAGVLGVWAIIRLANMLAERSEVRLGLILGTMSSACTLLFFGYIEQYTLSTALLLWWLVIAVQYYHRRCSWKAYCAMTVAMLASNLLLAPLALMLLLCQENRDPDRVEYCFGRLRTFPFLSICIVLAILVAAVIYAAKLRIAVVPLLPRPVTPYWSLSSGHLIDFANAVLHVAPVGTFSVAVILWLRKRTGGPEISIILTTAVLLVIASFWMEPILGAARDWDLLSAFGFPLTIAGVALLFRIASSEIAQNVLVTQSLMAMLLLLGPNLYEKNSMDRAAVRLDTILADAPQYQANYDNARDNAAWATILNNEVGRSELGDKYLLRRIQAEPTDPVAWHNFGLAEYRRGKLDSAVPLLQKAYTLEPRNGKYRMDLVLALQAGGEYAKAQTLMDDAGQSTDANSVRSRGVVLAQQGRYVEAIAAFHKALSSGRSDCSDFTNLALAFSRLGKADSSVFYFRLAVSQCPQTKHCQIWKAMVIEQLKLNDHIGARESFREYARQCPASPDIENLRKQVGE